MTIAALQATLQYLTAYKSDLEVRVSSISNERSVNAYAASVLGEQLSQSDSSYNISNNAQYQQYQWKDRCLEQKQKQLETQLKAATAQLESTQSAIDQNIKKDFKIGFSAQG